MLQSAVRTYRDRCARILRNVLHRRRAGGGLRPEAVSDHSSSLRIDHKGSMIRGPQVLFEFDRRVVTAYEGESIGAALMADGVVNLHCSTQTHSPRGLYCGMGICFECVAIVDDLPNVRTCVTEVTQGMRVQRQCIGAAGHSDVDTGPPDEGLVEELET